LEDTLETDGTTPPGGDNGKRQTRHQQRRDRWRQRWELSQQRLSRDRGPFRRPMWQEPLRGALYAAGSGIIGVAFAWFQHWL
jgi:hypothetical protein